MRSPPTFPAAGCWVSGRLRPDGVAVDVAVLFGHSVFAVAEGVRAAVRDIVGDLPIDVTVDDVVLAP
ncbi:hypothetical protein [Fodinicola feengrottensis]|uniref:hypothetical protein n=1 Tax=Fodinicola feengrottensis TaxID=435914 RepID=UPI0013CFEB92|nr:hypothetical protein [Fodinicola feengrottensis]